MFLASFVSIYFPIDTSYAASFGDGSLADRLMKEMKHEESVDKVEKPAKKVKPYAKYNVEIDEHTLEKLHKKYNSSNVNELVDEHGNTPLIKAITGNKIKESYFLIVNGADINVQNKYGGTPLIFAIGKKKDDMEDMAKFLISKGANINVRGMQGKTPLMFANSYNKNEIAQILIDSGADINAKDDDGWTPLMYAAIHGSTMEDTIDILIDKGADINQKSNKDRTVLMHIATSNIEEKIKTFKFVMDKGADKN